MQPATVHAKRKKMLLIDDDPKLLLGLKAIMIHRGYEVISTTDGQEGIQLARESRPDIIICDVMMPHPNGLQIKRILTSDVQAAEIPFIFLTARTFEVDKIAGLQEGADDYVTKPFSVDELIFRIEAILRRNEIGRQRGLREMEGTLEKMRQTISNNLGHELRTPLTVILANMEMAIREKFKGNSENLDWYLESILSSAQRLSLLVEDMILLNDIDQGSISSLRMPIDVDLHIMNPIRDVLYRYSQKDLNVQISVEDGVVIYAPQTEFTRAVTHLVDNACKFCPDDADVSIRFARNGIGGCLLDVENTGSFIPKELHEKVFERYYQIQQGDNRSYGGMGIGLTIARAIAKACGGNITIMDAKAGCKVRMTYPPVPVN